MKEMLLSKLKTAGIGVWLGIGAGIIAFVCMIMGATGKALLDNTGFGADIIIFVIVGMLLSFAAFFFRFNFWQLIPTLFYSLAFGSVINGGAAVIMDKINNVVYSGGDFTSVVIYLVLLGVACVLSIVACFLNPSRETQSEAMA